MSSRLRTTHTQRVLQNVAVEVVSPSDSAQDLEVKVDEYLAAGAKQVWVLYPKSKRVHVFCSDKPVVILDERQTLTGGDLLPHFSVKVADLFLNDSELSA